MTPAELVKTTRERKRLSQRRLALRAGTSQSAIARIERGGEEVTWLRLRSLMLAMGEEPMLSSRPLPSRYDADDLPRARATSPESRLANGIAFNKFPTQLAVAVRRSKKPLAAPDGPLRAADLLRALAIGGVEFVLVGGMAVQAHGYIRSTRDVDVVPSPPAAKAGRLSKALSALWAAAGAPSSFDELRSRALVVKLDGIEIPVAGRDDLIRMKRAAGRPQDLIDIGALTRDDEELEREARQST